LTYSRLRYTLCLMKNARNATPAPQVLGYVLSFDEINAATKDCAGGTISGFPHRTNSPLDARGICEDCTTAPIWSPIGRAIAEHFGVKLTAAEVKLADEYAASIRPKAGNR
jgi:hypothetical protein